MPELTTLLKGLAIGLLVAIPIGPVGVLCVQRTLDYGRLSGFISGLGAATVDAFYAAVTAFGLIIISNFIIEYQIIFRLFGGIFLLIIGIRSLYLTPQKVNIKTTCPSILADYSSTFFLTACNPITIIVFTALFVSSIFGFSNGCHYSATILVIGVFLGSSLWWFILSFGTGVLKSRTRNISIEVINKISGVIIIFFAIIVFGGALMNSILGYSFIDLLNNPGILLDIL